MGRYVANPRTLVDGQLLNESLTDNKGNVKVTMPSDGGAVTGAVYNSTAPTIVAGEVAPNQADVNGNLLVSLGTALSAAIDNVTSYPLGHTGTYCTSDTLIKTGSGVVHTITFTCIDAAPTAGTIIVYDNTAESGTIIYSETFDTTAFRGHSVELDIAFGTGLYVGFTTTADVGVTVSYR